ncbi:MAG TPA: putative glycoside hydrolase [Methylomirabilota bacterium]|jgi:hypothetical protein
MFEGPLGSATRKHVVDSGFAVFLLAAPIFFGYVVLAPDRVGLRVAARDARPIVASAIIPAPPVAPTPAVAATPPPAAPVTVPAPVVAPSPRAIVTPVATPPPRSGPIGGLRPVLVPPPTVTPLPAAPDVPRVSWPGTITVRVVDDEGRPVAGASIVAGGREHRVADDGSFTLTPPPHASLIAKHPGYRRVVVEPTTQDKLQIVLKPQVIKAAYLTYFGFGDRGIRGRVLDLLARTELNAVVIDVKGDRGWIIYPTKVELALSAGAQGPGTLRQFDALMAELKARDIYTIARIVTFKDNILAHHRPEWAVTDTQTGKPWMDRENLAWMDPFREEVWNYNIAIAHEAIERGFDEVQFDYVRFPTDGRLSSAKYAKPANRQTRVPAIAGFLERARKELGAHGGYVSADVFGYIAFNESDTDIGQRVEELAPHLDYISPMVYPSGYHVGIPGFRNPVQNSYQVVRESVRLIRTRAAHTPVRVRPWLQDFRDYAFDRRIFGVAEIRDQIRGTDEGGGTGWMLWNPRNNYTGAALRAKSPLAEN